MRKSVSTLILLLTILFLNVDTFAQNIILTDPNMTPKQAVENVLLGAGIDAFNIEYNGSEPNANIPQSSVRRFDNNGGVFPIEDGILLNTMGAPVIGADPDLNAIDLSGQGVTNGVIIEFDFVPSGDTLSFDYMFASKEYASYTCSNKNDVFGFFISGPGISGPYTNDAINIATIPGSISPSNPNGTPVGINTVNSGTASILQDPAKCFSANPNWQTDAQYWTDQFNGEMTSIGAGYNGETIVLTANSKLVCSDTFHIKMAIANVDDKVYDSGVFLAANSFASEGVDISIVANTAISDTMLIEGCSEGKVYFSRPPSQSTDTLVIQFHTGGDAIAGVDYPALAPGDSIVLYPGETIDSLVIAPIQDNIDEGAEIITISAFTLNACGDTIVSEGTIWIDDEPHSIVTSTDTLVVCAHDSIPLGAFTEDDFSFTPYSYSWYEIGTQDSLFGDTVLFKISEYDSLVQYLVTSTDACGFQYSDTASIVLNQTLHIDSMKQFMASCGLDDGAVVGFGSGFTGTPHYTWSDTIGPGGNSTSSTAWPDLPAGWYYYSIKDDVCEVNDSILVEQTPPPEASFDADPQEGYSPLDVTFTNTSDPADTYIWDFGNGQGVTVNDLDDQGATYIDEGTYTVTLFLESGACSDEATKEITVILPVTYDMTNVFTPNGDGENDLFTINAENASALEIVILNRWGNVVFSSNEVDFKWDGKNSSGAAVADGTYFYKFTITDHTGIETQEHGFVQIVR